MQVGNSTDINSDAMFPSMCLVLSQWLQTNSVQVLLHFLDWLDALHDHTDTILHSDRVLEDNLLVLAW